MSNHEEVFPKMNVCIYLSCTSNSKKVANFCNDFLHYELLEARKVNQNISYNNVLLVYPVHSQNIPKNLLPLLKNIQCKKMIAIATYGRIKHGNSLFALRYKFQMPLIGACYFLTKHSYLKNDGYEPNYLTLLPLLKRFQDENSKVIEMRKSPSTFGYNLLPTLRAQLGLKITFDKRKCISCNLCGLTCLNKAITNGKINRHCIRCLACISNCPTKALDFKMKKILEIYLKNQKDIPSEIY